MSQYFWIFFGSGLGGLARFALSGLVAERVGETFPWGTFVVNFTGSFVIGFVATLLEPGGRLLVGPNGRQFLLTGIMGGFTTYSSFSLQTMALAREGEWLRAGGNAFGTFILCFVAVWVGYLCAAWINTLKGS